MDGALGWITAVTVCIALLQYLSESRGRVRERRRLEKAQASFLTAWTVSDQTSHPKAYGVVIDNASGSMFHDVELDAIIHKAPVPTVRLPILAPGRFFVQLNAVSGGWQWEFAKEQSEHGRPLRPNLNSNDYRVMSVRFVDNRNQRWLTDQHSVLKKRARRYGLR